MQPAGDTSLIRTQAESLTLEVCRSIKHLRLPRDGAESFARTGTPKGIPQKIPQIYPVEYTHGVKDALFGGSMFAILPRKWYYIVYMMPPS